eukprot:gene2802-3095_t
METARETAAAVQALLAAGDNKQALKDAILKAAFLDITPGEDRQKLRAARTRLRKVLAAEDAANSGASGSGSLATGAVGAAAISPHAKSSYDANEFESLAQQYEGLKWRMISKPGGAAVKPDEFYKLHGFHQQASIGDNNTTERPMWAEKGGLDFEGRARWDAWSAVKGMPAEDAKLRFVKLYYEFSPACLYADTRGGVTA